MERWQLLALGAGGAVLGALAYSEFVSKPSLLTVMDDDDEAGTKGSSKKGMGATGGLQASPDVKRLIAATSFSSVGAEASKSAAASPSSGGKKTAAPGGGWREDALAAVYDVAGRAADALLETFDKGSMLGKVKGGDDEGASAAQPVEEAPLTLHREGGRLSIAARNPKESIYYKNIADEAARYAKMRKHWQDPDMPQTDASVYGSTPGSKEARFLVNAEGKSLLPEGVTVQWHPPQDFCATNKPQGVTEAGKPTWLYVEDAREGLSPPADAEVGVGDSFTSAVLAAAQHSPFICDELILNDHEAQGIYGVALHSGGAWTLVWVDWCLPCYRRAAASPTTPWRLLFGGSHDQVETWAAVVFKAYAKLCGSYEVAVSRGVSAFLEHIFGGKGRTLRLSGLQGEKAHMRDVVWSAIMTRGALFVAAGSKPAHEAASIEGMNGILPGHTYSVLGAVEAAGVRLIQLRDPVSKRHASTWTGAWREADSKWGTREGKELRAAIAKAGAGAGAGGADALGAFWMSFGDFLAVFETVETCAVVRTSEEAKTDKALLAFAAEGGGAACLKPGLRARVNKKHAQAAAEDMMRRLIDEEERGKKGGGAGGGKGKGVKKRAAAPKAKGARKGSSVTHSA